jgi:DnaJ-class molecular chaperone
LLIAYFLNITNKIEKDSLVYLLLNFAGAGIACLASVLISYMPFIILEASKIGKDFYPIGYVKSHAVFTREDLNLVMDLKIKLTDALLGMTYNLLTLEGKKIEVKIPEGINNGEILRVKGKGVPSTRGRGDILINIEVVMPNKLSRKNKEIIEKLKEEGL